MKEKTLNTTKYSIELHIGQAVECVPVIVRKHPKSRRMIIRYQPKQHHVCLTLPRYISIRQGLDFILQKRTWLEEQIREKICHIPLVDGQKIPVLGHDYILHHAGGRGVITTENDRIIIHGEASFMKRRLREWLKLQLHGEIFRIAQGKAQQIGKPIKKISLRDTSSRWGSCSHDASLSFSWRLVFAPQHVLEYVVTHEVAHLAQHNHSPAFWAIVEALCPDYKTAQHWLKESGALLHAYT